MFLTRNDKYVKSINQSGVILVDMLISLSFFLLLVSFFPILIQMILDKSIVSKELQNMEWQVFLNQLKEEVHVAQSIQVSNNKLLLYIDGDTVYYEQYGTRIRRRVNLTGHEVALQNINFIVFTPKKSGVNVSIMDIHNQMKEASLYSYLILDGDT